MERLYGQVPQGRFVNEQVLLVDANNQHFDYDPRVSADSLTLYFSSNDCLTAQVTSCISRPGSVGEDIWMATRNSVDERFSGYTRVSALNTDDHENIGGLSSDELTVYFSSGPLWDSDLFMAHRTSIDQAFGEAVPLSELNSGEIEIAGSVSADGLTIVYSKQQSLSAPLEIWTASRETVNQAFANPRPVSAVNSYSSAKPTLSADGLVLFLMDGWTNPVRTNGFGANDIWVSFRSDTTQDFGPPQNLNQLWPESQINTPLTDGTPYPSPDWPLAGSKLYFSRGNSSNARTFTLYEAEWVTAPGDLDASGVLDARDMDLLTAEVLAGTHRPGFDQNQDALVNQADRDVWITTLKQTYYGDANLDGEFNSSDFTQVFLAGEYEDAIDDNSGWAEGDWDGDGDFTSGDFVTAFLDGGYEQGPRPAAAVPEPSAFLLTALALLTLATMHRKPTAQDCA